MSEELSPMCSWAKLYHPKGVLVTIPFPVDPIACMDAVAAALDAGWLVTAPGLEEGEENEMVGWVLQGSLTHDGRETAFVLLYSVNDAYKWSFLKVYLNTEADVKAFEYASKMRLDKVTPYVGNDKPQRGASPKTDRFIFPVPRPFGVVFKKNPKHDPNTEEGKMKPARLFVRWADQKTTQAAPPKSPAVQQAEQFIGKAQAALTPTKVKELLSVVSTMEERQALWESLPDAITDTPEIQKLFIEKAKELREMERQLDRSLAKDR